MTTLSLFSGQVNDMNVLFHYDPEHREPGVCTASWVCPIAKHYIMSGGEGAYYRGEMCDKCLWWQPLSERAPQKGANK